MISFEARRDQLRRERKPSRIDNPNEFDQLVHHLRQSAINCGADHAQSVAQSFSADFGWDSTELLRATGLRDDDPSWPCLGRAAEVHLDQADRSGDHVDRGRSLSIR